MERQLTPINLGLFTAFKVRIKYAENVKENHFSGFWLRVFLDQLPTAWFEFLLRLRASELDQ
jgi:hypothetical protein